MPIGMKLVRLGLMMAGLALAAPLGRAQSTVAPGPGIETLKKNAPRVYIDCGSCDIDYIKTEVTFVNYVRDRKEAQIHVLITTQATGSEGREYLLSFLGQNEFAGVDDTVQFFANKTDTDDEVRRGLVSALKLGLAAYASRTPIAARLDVRYTPPEGPGAAADRWNSWIFSLSGNGYFQGEESMSSNSWGLNLSANRITPDIKIRLGVSGNFQGDRFDYEGETTKSFQENYNFSGLYVRSLGEHWSAGFALDVSSSTYENTKLSIRPTPAVEFNVYPYSQSGRRQLRILYKVGPTAVRYREETIYLKTAETLWNESLSLTLDVKEKWGSISTSLSGSHYFPDLTKYNLNLSGSVNLNLFKGLSAFAAGGGSRIHDQLALVKGDASLDEILLRRRQLATGYNYFLICGISYTFGSIYTNVVNPRFGSMGSGGMQLSMN
jgi:hypothetical protein